jgi:gliding motility-associated protein GldM
MGGGKETPRQKMIGMMYLFLTAMLAINVSKEVLDSFVLVNDSLTVTVENFKTKNQKMYADFEKQKALNEAKVSKWNDLAQQVRVKAEELSDYLKGIKIELVTVAEGPKTLALAEGDVVASLISAKDNATVGDQIMIGPTGDARGKELRIKVEEFRSFLFSIVPEVDRNTVVRGSISKSLSTNPPPPKEGVQQTWEYGQFAHMPLVAVITMLTKMQSDIRNAEADVLRFLYGQIDESEFKFNKLEGLVIPKSNMIINGEEFTASVFIAARDSTQDPKIYIGSYEKTASGEYQMRGSYETLSIKNGVGAYRTVGRRTGQNEWGGLIEMTAPDGSIKRYPFKNTFQVNEPMAVISASANTVFYSGISNPLEVSVPGLPMDKIFPTLTGNARLNKKGDKWEVVPTAPGGSIKITVAIEVDGKRQTIGNKDFKILPVPPPTAKISGRSSGNISRRDIVDAGQIEAVLEGFIMDNIKYTVKSYTVVTKDASGFDSFEANNEARYNDRVLGKLRALQRNDRVTFENIIATGPDGDKNIGNLVYRIN